jgi:Adenylate cyclase, family 3 (some proteins contain HAMP domain)
MAESATLGLLKRATAIAEGKAAAPARRRRERFIPIGLKLIGIISFLLVAALATMVVLATYYFTSETERTLKLNTLERSELIAQKLESQLGALRDKTSLFASSLEGSITVGGTDAKLSSLFFEQDSGLLAVCIVRRSASGKGYFVDKSASDPDRLSQLGVESASPNAWISGMAEALEGAFAGSISVANASPELGSPVLALAIPAGMRGGGEADSVAVAFETMDQMNQALSSRELYTNMVTGPRGEVIAHQDRQLVLSGASLRSSPIVKDSLVSSMDPKQLGYEEKGRQFLGSYKKILSGSLTVFSVVDERAALEAVYQIQRRNILIVAIVLAAALILALFFSRSLTAPIKRLVDATNRIAEGDYELAIDVRNHDELGRLTEAFQDMGKGLAEREKIKTAFGKFVNKEVAERVMRDEVSLGGETKQATIFFSDIRSFTEISEHLSPHEVVEFLNDYMTRMVGCVNKTHGVVDKYIGDAIMAVWGVPYKVGNDAENAIDGALLMRSALMSYNASREGTSKPFLKIGCGINSGPVVAGQIGSMERMEYTVIGDAVNLASRIESLNKPFHTDILVSQETYERVQGIYKVEPMKRITVKGKAEPQQIYAVVGRLDDPSCPAGLDEVRKMVGWETGPIGDVDPDAHEEKFKVIE